MLQIRANSSHIHGPKDPTRMVGSLPPHAFVVSSRVQPLNPSNICNRVIHLLLKIKGLPPGGSHILRHFRMTCLRENTVPAEIERFWLVHVNRTVAEDYSMLKKNLNFHKQMADRIGVGFELPDSITSSAVPNILKITAQATEEVLA